jgi:biopolymer transport protein ExbB
MNVDYLMHLAAESGGILYLMAVLLLVALTVIIERGWYLSRAISHGEAITRQVLGLTHFDRSAILSLARREAAFPHGMVLGAPLNHPDLADPSRLSEVLEEAILLQAQQIDRRMWILDTIVTLAPLLGLLGTIVGMFNAFEVLGKPGSPPTAVTGGIAEALVATACGLFIAIVGLVAFNGLHNSVRVILHQLECIKVMLVNRLQAPSAPRPKAAAQPGLLSPALSGARA